MKRRTKMKLNDVPPEEWDKLKHKQFQVDAVRYDGIPVEDVVNKPKHYNKGSMEAIDYINQQLETNSVYYLEGSILKYLHRWKYKNGVEDLKKARWYLDRLIEEKQKEKEEED